MAGEPAIGFGLCSTASVLGFLHDQPQAISAGAGELDDQLARYVEERRFPDPVRDVQHGHAGPPRTVDPRRLGELDHVASKAELCTNVNREVRRPGLEVGRPGLSLAGEGIRDGKSC